MIVLGLDPGFAAFGVAAVELFADGDVRPVAVWVVRTEPSPRKRAVRASEDNVRRAQEIAAGLEAAVGRWRPVALAAECMSWPRYLGAAVRVALGWGVVCSVAHRHGVPLVQASPQDVKKALLGKKTASKEEVLVEPERPFRTVQWTGPAGTWEHQADAVAVVLACLDSPVLQMARGLSRVAAVH